MTTHDHPYLGPEPPSDDVLSERVRLLEDHIRMQNRLIERLDTPAVVASALRQVNLVTGGSVPSDCEAVGPMPADVAEAHQYMVVWKALASPNANGMIWHVEVWARSAYEAYEAVRYRDSQLGRDTELVGVLDLSTVR